jgi:type VI secretion system protein ImpB
VETNGQMEARELPFVVGVLADLSGQPAKPLDPLKERKFVNIDRDTFNSVLQKAAPRLAMKVANRLTDDNTSLALELNFKSFDDFEPARIAQQIGPLRELLEARQRLTELLAKGEGNDKLEQLLAQVLNNTDLRTQLAEQIKPQEAAQPEEPK